MEFEPGIQGSISPERGFSFRGAPGPGRSVAGLLQEYAGISEAIRALPADQQEVILRQADAGRFGEFSLPWLVTQFGEEVLYATPGQFSAIVAALNKPLTDTEGNAVIDEETGEVRLLRDQPGKLDHILDTIDSDVIDPIREKLSEEKRIADAIGPLYDVLDRLDEIEEMIRAGGEEEEAYYRELAQTPVLTDEELAPMLRQAYDLIQREFGEGATAAAGTLASRGFGTGTFSATLEAMNRQRSLEAQLGANAEFRQLQETVNAENAYKYNALLAQTKDATRARLLFVEDLARNTVNMISQIQAGLPFTPLGTIDLAEHMDALVEDLNSGRILAEELDPDIWQLLGEGVVTAITERAIRAATGFLGG